MPQERETFYRNTQPTFHITVEKTEKKAAKTRVETPKLAAGSPKSKIKSEQKDLLKEIANTNERRQNPVYMVQNRRFRNTANSFVSDQSSSKPESIQQVNINSTAKKGSGNDDLAEVAVRKEKENRRAREKSNHKKQRN